MIRVGAALLVCSALFSAPAVAQNGITLHAGYAASEGIDNVNANESARVDSGPTFSLALDLGFDASRQTQILFLQQSTTLDPRGGVAPFDIDVRYLHLGGTYFFEGAVGQGPYVVGGFGATFFSPSLNGLSSETRASVNLGFGYLWPLSSALALRAEARAFFTLLNSSGGFLCSGGCVVTLSGDSFTQGIAMLGLSARF